MRTGTTTRRITRCLVSPAALHAFQDAIVMILTRSVLCCSVFCSLAFGFLKAPGLAADSPPRKKDAVVVLADFDGLSPDIRSSDAVRVQVESVPQPLEKADSAFEHAQFEGANELDRTTADKDRGAIIAPRGRGCRLKAQSSGGTAFSAPYWPSDWCDYAMLYLWIYRESQAERPDQIELRCVEADGLAHFWRKIELNHRGWKLLVVPLQSLRWGDRRVPRWDAVKHLVFYCRTATDDLWIDSIQLALGTERDSAELSGPWLARLAFPNKRADEITIVARQRVELLTDSARIESDRLANHLQQTAETVLRDLPIATDDQRIRGTLIVFDREADYRQFIPRLAAYWNSQGDEPKSGGFTIQAIATSSFSEQHGTLRPVFTHEFVHSLMARALRITNRGEWLHEGLANYYQLRFHPQEGVGRIVLDGIGQADMHLPLKQLCNGRPIPMNRYWQAMTLVEMFLTDETCRLQFAKLLEAFSRNGSTDLEPHLGLLGGDWPALTERWKRFCRETYRQ